MTKKRYSTPIVARLGHFIFLGATQSACRGCGVLKRAAPDRPFAAVNRIQESCRYACCKVNADAFDSTVVRVSTAWSIGILKVDVRPWGADEIRDLVVFSPSRQNDEDKVGRRSNLLIALYSDTSYFG